jgi:hypothetical protein
MKPATMQSAAVMFDYRRLALWIAVLLVPGGILLLPLLLANRHKQKKALLAATRVSGDDPKTPSDGKGSNSRSTHGTTPRMAA